MRLRVLWHVVGFGAAAVREVTVKVFQDLMDQNQAMAVAFIREQQAIDPDRLQNELLPYVPKLVKMDALDCLQQMKDDTWKCFCSSGSLSDVRKNLINMFPPKLQKQLNLALIEGQTNPTAASGLFKLLKIMKEQRATGYQELVGTVLAAIPPEIFHQHILPQLTLCSELALSSTCHYLRDCMLPSVRERYMTTEPTRLDPKRIGFRFSLVKLFGEYEASLRKSDQQNSIREFMRKNKQARLYEREIFDGAMVKSLGISDNILRDLVFSEVDPEILVLLIRTQAENVLLALEYQSFVTIWFLDYPEMVINAIIKHAPKLPMDSLMILDDARFSRATKWLLLERYGMKFSEIEYTFILQRIPHRDMLERVLVNFDNDDYLFTAEQIQHFLKLDVSTRILDSLLVDIEADIRNDNLMQGLLRKGVSEASLLAQLQYRNAACRYSNATLRIAIERDYSDGLLEPLIRMARDETAEMYTGSLRSTASSSDEYYDWI